MPRNRKNKNKGVTFTVNPPISMPSQKQIAASMASRKVKNKNKNRRRLRDLPIQSQGFGRNALGSRETGVSIGRKIQYNRQELSYAPAVSRRFGNGLRVRGSDFLQTILTPSAITAGGVLLSSTISPPQFDGTRIKQMAALFERYEVNSWQFHFVPSVASTTQGLLLMYPEYDVADSVGPTPIQQGEAHMGSVMFNIYTEAGVEFVRNDPFTDLFVDPTGSDERLTAIGKLILLAVSNVPTNLEIGSLFMTYDINFYIPQLSPPILGTQLGNVPSVAAAYPGDRSFSALTTAAAGSFIPTITLTNAGGSPQALPINTVYSGLISSTVNGFYTLGEDAISATKPIECFIKMLGSNTVGGSTTNLASTAVGAVYSTLAKAITDTPTTTTGTGGSTETSGSELFNSSGASINIGSLSPFNLIVTNLKGVAALASL